METSVNATKTIRQARALLATATATAVAGCAAIPTCTPMRLAPPPVVDIGDITNRLSSACLVGDYNGMSPYTVVRYAKGPTDSIRHPDRVIAGPHTGLCSPDAIALGPKGELYVLNHRPDNRSRSSSDDEWISWVTVYDSAATGDALPIRALHPHVVGLKNPSTLAVDRNGYLYIGSSVDAHLDSGSVVVFEAGSDGDVKPLRVISGPSTGLRWPLEIALDRGGNLYVTSGKYRSFPWFPGSGDIEDTVRVFASTSMGDITPCRMLAGQSTGLHQPHGLVVDRKGQLYLTGGRDGYNSAKTDAINVYLAGATGDMSPFRTLTGEQIFDAMREPRRLAIDSYDSLYVRSSSNFTVFGPESSSTAGPARTFHRNVPDLFALDRHDTLYSLSGDSVLVRPPGYTGVGPPIRTITGVNKGMRGATDIALDSGGSLYLLVSDSSLVRVYPPGSSGVVSPSRTIGGLRTGLNHPRHIALDRQDRLYLTNGPRPGGGGMILVYAPGAGDEDRPSRRLLGPETQLTPPRDIEFDSGGNMYVLTSAEPGVVLVFRSGEDSNATPLRTVEGPSTLFRHPAALAFGRSDTLYALNVFGSRSVCFGRSANATVTAYAPGASGEAEPVRTIVLTQNGQSPGQKYGLSGWRDLAVDSSGAVQVWYPGGAMVYPSGASGAVAPSQTILEDPGAKNAELAAVAVAEDGTVYQTTRQPQRCWPFF